MNGSQSCVSAFNEWNSRKKGYLHVITSEIWKEKLVLWVCPEYEMVSYQSESVLKESELISQRWSVITVIMKMM